MCGRRSGRFSLNAGGYRTLAGDEDDWVDVPAGVEVPAGDVPAGDVAAAGVDVPAGDVPAGDVAAAGVDVPAGDVPAGDVAAAGVDVPAGDVAAAAGVDVPVGDVAAAGVDVPAGDVPAGDVAAAAAGFDIPAGDVPAGDVAAAGVDVHYFLKLGELDDTIIGGFFSAVCWTLFHLLHLLTSHDQPWHFFRLLLHSYVGCYGYLSDYCGSHGCL